MIISIPIHHHPCVCARAFIECRTWVHKSIATMSWQWGVLGVLPQLLLPHRCHANNSNQQRPLQMQALDWQDSVTSLSKYPWNSFLSHPLYANCILWRTIQILHCWVLVKDQPKWIDGWNRILLALFCLITWAYLCFPLLVLIGFLKTRAQTRHSQAFSCQLNLQCTFYLMKY